MTTFPIPVVPGIDDVDPTMRCAVWDALTLLDAGWQLRKMRYHSRTGTATLDLHTPTHRALTILSTGALPDEPIAGAAARAVRLAAVVAIVGQRGGSHLDELRWMLSGQIHSNRTPSVRRDRVPDHVLGARRAHQPANFRTAFWLLATLVVDYGWLVGDIGDPIAGGGFIADIPDDVTAIFPASMELDGTTAAQLARLIPQLDPRSLGDLRRITPSALAAAHHAAAAAGHEDA